MEYRYPPLYKYIILLLIIFLFLIYYKCIDQNNYLYIAIFFTLVVILLDYMLIDNHANIIDSETHTELFDQNDLDEILDLKAPCSHPSRKKLVPDLITETDQDSDDSEGSDF